LQEKIAIDVLGFWEYFTGAQHVLKREYFALANENAFSD
jgi:hypothetical protein